MVFYFAHQQPARRAMSDSSTATTSGTVPAASTATRRWRTEDWIAVVLGFLVITTVLAVFQWKVADLGNVVSTFRWTTDSQIAALTPGWIDALDTIARDAEAKKQANVVSLSKDLRDALLSKDRKAIETAAGKLAALGNRTVAGTLGSEIRGHTAAVAQDKVFSRDNLLKVLYVGLGFFVVSALGVALLGARVVPFLVGLPVVFGLA